MSRVHSRLNKSIQYQEHRTVDKEDEDGEYPVLELHVGDAAYSIIVGKPKYTYAKDYVIYFPIYLVQYGGIIRAQIGVFEVSPGHVTEVWQPAKGGLNIKKAPSPLFYSFVNESFLEAAHCRVDSFRKHRDADLSSSSSSLTKKRKQQHLKNIIQPISLEKDDDNDQDDKNEDEDEDEDEARFSLPSTKKKNKKKDGAATDDEENKIDVDSIFQSVEPAKNLPELPEETEESAEKQRKSYDSEIASVDKQHHSWLQKHMKSTAYRILPMDPQNSFFKAVVDAFSQVGKKTTVTQLRRLLADHLTDEVFEEERQLYVQFSVALEELDRQIASLRDLIDGHKKEIKKTPDKFDKLKVLTEEAQQWTRELADVEAQRKQTAALRTQYVGHMEHIQTLDAMREHIRTAAFEINAWGIQTLEYLLNMKTIVFSEEAFDLGQTMSVLQCGAVPKQLADKQRFEPDYYILLAVSASSNVHDLVSYYDHTIFRFKEIPFDVKVNILKKCMEKNAGPFYFIPEFENLKTKYHMDANDGHPDDFSLLPEFERDKLFDPDVVFVIHEKGSVTKKPGYADNESIKHASKLHEFASLANIKGWRQILDDSYGKVHLNIDGKRWKSVEHYVLGSRYKKSHPDVYALFSLGYEDGVNKQQSKEKENGESVSASASASASASSSSIKIESIATDLKMARKYVQQQEKKPSNGKIKQKTIAVDPSFDAEKEREIALKAKFLDNLDLRHVLVSTKNALLLHGGKVGVAAQPDILLMRLRKEATAI